MTGSRIFARFQGVDRLGQFPRRGADLGGGDFSGGRSERQFLLQHGGLILARLACCIVARTVQRSPFEEERNQKEGAMKERAR